MSTTICLRCRRPIVKPHRGVSISFDDFDLRAEAVEARRESSGPERDAADMVARSCCPGCGRLLPLR